MLFCISFLLRTPHFNCNFLIDFKTIQVQQPRAVITDKVGNRLTIIKKSFKKTNNKQTSWDFGRKQNAKTI